MLLFSRVTLFLIFCLDTSFAEEVFSTFVKLDEYQSNTRAWVIYEEKSIIDSKIQITTILNEAEKVINAGLIECIRNHTDSKGIISFRKLKKCGLTTKIDLKKLEVNIEIKDKGRRKNFLNVSQSQKESVEKIYSPSLISGYFNFRALQELSNIDLDRQPGGSFESVINLNGLVFESRLTYQQNSSTSQTVVRDYSKLTYDFQKNMARLTLGDIDQQTRGFQDRIAGLGISYSKEFSIDPQFFRSSFKKYGIFLNRPSTIEIYLNGRLVKTTRAPKGPLEITDFPFVSGENIVKIRTIDDFGEVKIVDFSNIADSKLLSNGISDYSINLIFPRKDNFLSTDLSNSFQEDYDFSEGVLSSFFHKGIGDNLVLGFESQVGARGGLVGLESTIGNQFGVSKVNFISSAIKENKNSDLELSDTGFGLRLENESLLMRKGELSNFRLNTGLEYQDKNFQRYDSPIDRYKFTLRSSVAQNFRNQIRGSLGFSKSWGHESKNHRTLLFSNFGWNFLKNWDLSSSIKINIDDERDSTVLLSVSWSSPVQNKQFLSTFDPQNESGTSEFTYFPIRDTNNLRVRVGGSTFGKSKSVSGGLEYLNQRLELKGNYVSSLRENGENLNIATLSGGIGLAFSNHHLSITRPVANSFAIIGMSDKPFGLKVPIDRYGRAKRAEINIFGPAVINTLAPYFTDQISVDGAALPYGLTVKNESFKFRPTYKSGVYLDVAVESKTSITGSVKRRDNGAIDYLTGKVFEVVNGKEIFLTNFFTGSDGHFTIEGVKKKQYIVEFYDDDIKFKKIGINVDQKSGFYQLKKPLSLVREND